jgi:hypothetical protein
MDGGGGAGQWRKMARWRRHSSSAGRRGGCAGWCGNGKEVRLRLRGTVVVIDGGGAMRTPRQRQEVRRWLHVEDEQERKKNELSWLYKD